MPNSLTEIANPTDDSSEDYLTSLVGEGKKYQSPEELARAYHNADKHIRELREDNEVLRSEKTTIEEVLEEIRKKETPNGQTPVNNAANSGSITKEDVAEVVNQTMIQHTTEQTRAVNVSQTLSKLDEAYGSREASMKALGKAIGGNEAVKKVLDDLSFVDPDAAVTFVLARAPIQEVKSNVPGAGKEDGVHAGGDLPKGIITWSTAKKTRREDPATYHSHEFRRVMEQSAQWFSDKGKDWFAT